ncbi:hypothetical protein [Methanococcus voltae]|uniref:Uncharacterized protein n=1 Tax=Methanococcus voltae (strain ATCC BAA-1334 / A3) TaxID=456320 RepID=D7DUK7_METV3|nr:hypothetical protein [Methanococcus voltae]MCS3900618.1 hypothetical protein [Methanococcus voltae]
MVKFNSELKKLAELILLKDPAYENSENLKTIFKKYISLYNEIEILEETLDDLDIRSINMSQIQVFNEELKIYSKMVDDLKEYLKKINRNHKLYNYDEVLKNVNKLKDLKVNTNDEVRWDLYNRLRGLEENFHKVERDLELNVLNYALCNTDLDVKILQYPTQDIFELLKQEISLYLTPN